MNHTRFAYEEAEQVLDAFAMAPQRTKQFKRAYRKFKFMLGAYAYSDFDVGDRPQSLSYAWEDAQVAFTGRGEPALTGVILQMWVHVPEEEHKDFAKVIRKAFRKAEDSTGPDVPRRYMARWRKKPIRFPSEGFTLPTILPSRGVKLREWAEDNDQDVGAVEEQHFWLELADRELAAEEKVKRTRRPKAGLRLVKDDG